MTGRRMQSVRLTGGIDQTVGGPLAPPTSVSLQVVEPWSNAQSWPPEVNGSRRLLCSLTELSGTHTEPSVPVNVNGDQLVLVAGVKPPAGKGAPLLHVAHAKFCSMNVNAVVVAAILRILRAEHVGEFRRTFATASVKVLGDSELMLTSLIAWCPARTFPGRPGVDCTSLDAEGASFRPRQ